MAVMAFAQTVELGHGLVCRSCAGGRGTRGLEGAGWERVPWCLERPAGHALRVPIIRHTPSSFCRALGQPQVDGFFFPQDSPALNIEFS